jgi:hypothetical protein
MMGYSIRQKADRIGGFRFVSVFLMETLAAWIPTTPELEAKLLFGRHVWDFAQHADQLGRRTGELRAPSQYSHPPTDSYRSVLETLAAAEGTLERVEGFYDGFLPDFERRLRAHMLAVDPIDDEPSIRVIERILNDFPRLRADREAFARERPDLLPAETGWAGRIAALAAAERDMVSERPGRREAVAAS